MGWKIKKKEKEEVKLANITSKLSSQGVEITIRTTKS
jgi:hypothetical protein